MLSTKFTPLTFVTYLRYKGVFDGKHYVPDYIAEKASMVSVINDVSYPSEYKSNTLDIYYPSDGSAARAVVFWVHGGGFISGDKGDAKVFATGLVEQGYAVVAINYAVAPETHYPAPVVQLGEAYKFISENQSQYPQLDMDKLVFGGDSAGAQISSQFVALQLNAKLQAQMGIKPMIDAEKIKAAVLYCGPYNLGSFKDVEGDFMKTFVEQIGWAYLGKKDWWDMEETKQVSAIDFVTSDFPQTFITDGNTGSFEEQRKELAKTLLEKGVKTETLFYPSTEVVLPHEYQFDYYGFDEQAKECLTKTLAFLDSALSALT